MPWIEILLFMVVVFVATLMVQGIIQFVRWFIEAFVEPRQLARSKKNLQPQPDHSASPSSSISHRKEGDTEVVHKRKVSVTHPPAVSESMGLLGFLKRFLARKNFTYWVGLALGETNHDKRVFYCSKALRLNAGYEPAWGLKGNALLELKRYEEAVPCFDRVLEMRPNSMAWYKKGLCYYHLKRYEEAIACFDRALAACTNLDRQLSTEISRFKRNAEETLLTAGSESGKP